ncbi:MAG: prolipoprotein diacylglyceryl transferase [Saccharofermentanales bacterium]
MLDEHISGAKLGLLPSLHVFGISMPMYAVFMILAFASAFICYKLTAEKLDKEMRSNRFLIIVFALLGGIIGAKLPVLIYNYDIIFKYPQNIDLLLSGRTIVGGLIGGFISVLLVKRILKIEMRTGNDIAAPAALGMAVGRVGCLLSGCCYGAVSPAWLGIDLGDGLYRYPTQIYEIIFDLGLFFIFLYIKGYKEPQPGVLFRYLLNSYLAFRFFLEFIRVTDKGFLGLSYYQIICILCLIFINRRTIAKIFAAKTHAPEKPPVKQSIS